jgi:hypothetical protein
MGLIAMSERNLQRTKVLSKLVEDRTTIASAADCWLRARGAWMM